MFKKKLSSVVVLLVISGCQLTGGQAAYEAEPIEMNSGEIVCCKITVNNTKNIDLVEVNFEKSADGSVKLSVKEKGVNASDPAAVMAETNKNILESLLNKVVTGN
tara:strand:+ start:640 stop:954 length:315 start_codon:yes stop_codon:yes gene_type:complete